MKKVEILLINPDSGVNRDLPNVNLAYVATHFKAPVVDYNTLPGKPECMFQYATKVMGISVQSHTAKEAQHIAERYRYRVPDVKIKSISGPIDVFCCYPFIDYQEKVEYAPEFSDQLVFPDYSLFDSFEVYKKNWRKGAWHYPIMTSLGCPYQCSYCASRNRKSKTRSIDNVIAELKEASSRYNMKSFGIVDECFNLDKKRVIDFCKQVKKLGLTWVASGGLRADLFDDETARAMKESGCNYVGFGIESVDDNVLLKTEKGESRAQIEQAIKIAHRYFGSRVHGFFIIGLPGSSYKSDKYALQWALRNNLSANFSTYVTGNNVNFYGPHARISSKAYPEYLQKKLYRLVKHMWLGTSAMDTIKKAIGQLKLILIIDPLRLPIHLFNGIKRLCGC